jgi:FtsP/CotA-like multicopper oxidase with cupredoxin domain
MKRRHSFCTLLLCGAFSAGASAGVCDPGTVAAPASFDGVVRPALAEDVNPAADVVEIFLTAREAVWDFNTGNDTAVFTYNGVLPGPMIEANVGDKLIVHLCNDLPVDTTIHWHGLETPANMDGSNISQAAVPPGGTFRYEFPLLVAGTFWYHPHIQTHVQVEKGLYGALIVHDPQEDARLGLPEDEHVFMLDDVWLDEDGQIVEPFLGTREEVAIEQLNGREGNAFLLNGDRFPILTMERGVPHRIRVLNVANSRYMRVSIPDISMWRIGGDQGLIEHAILVPPSGFGSPPLVAGGVADGPGNRHESDPDPKTGLLLSPGERADVVLVLAESEPVWWAWHDTQRGRHSVDFLPDGTVVLAHDIPDGSNEVIHFALVVAEGPPGATEWVPPDPLTRLTPIDTEGAPALPLVMGHTVPDWNTGEVTFFVQAPGKPFQLLTPQDVHSVLTHGTYVWEVKNLTGSHHNFHTHGWGFQHIETEFVDLDFPNDPDRNYIEPATHLENKDTFLIKRRPGTVPLRSWSIGRFAVNFRDTGREGQIAASGKVAGETTSGGWLAHCHILEHSARGMMTFFQIADIFMDGFESGDTSAWSATIP